LPPRASRRAIGPDACCEMNRQGTSAILGWRAWVGSLRWLRHLEDRAMRASVHLKCLIQLDDSWGNLRVRLTFRPFVRKPPRFGKVTLTPVLLTPASLTKLPAHALRTQPSCRADRSVALPSRRRRQKCAAHGVPSAGARSRGRRAPGRIVAAGNAAYRPLQVLPQFQRIG